MTTVDLDDAVEELIAIHAAGTDRTELWKRQFDLGLAWLTLEEGLGGRGLDTPSRADVERRLQHAELPHPRSVNFVGVGMAAPLIAEHGTDRQRRDHLRPIFTADHLWCQLFSEPSAGSDLANVSTSAARDGDSWIINGQKVWTSFARNAQYALLLTRSDPDVPKHQGMTFFLLDMTTPGVEVRPLRMMTGDAEFSEIFLDDVVVSDAARIGEPGMGWTMALAVLMNERVAVGNLGGGRRSKRPIERIRAEAPPILDGVARDRLSRLTVRDQVQRLTKRRAATLARKGTPGPEGTVLRILNTQLNVDVHEFGIDLAGPTGTLLPHPYPHGDDLDPPDHWELSREFLFARGLMIGGGTFEIARNILGERVLGLPPEPRVDKQLPWKDQRR